MKLSWLRRFAAPGPVLGLASLLAATTSGAAAVPSRPEQAGTMNSQRPAPKIRIWKTGRLMLLLGLLLSGLAARAQGLRSQIPAAEYDALVELYQTTGGPAWDRRSGWLNPQAADWQGVGIGAGHVTRLELNYNQLSGSIPASLGHLTQLQDLILNGNQLSGSLPENLGDLTQLTYLSLGNNRLSGGIPTSLGNLTQLTHLFLHANQLSGSIPAGLGNLTQLQQLYLANNQLSGNIPASLGDLTQLREFDLSLNQLSGSIPASLGTLTQLYFLDLHGNQLSGEVPAFSAFRRVNIDLRHNALDLSEGSQSLANIKALIAAGNRVTYQSPLQQIPAAEYDALVDLYHATGGPAWRDHSGWLDPQADSWEGVWIEAGHVTSLTLNHKQLSGSIPASFSNLTQLQILSLHGNQLSGSIPEGLGDFAQLQQLFLSGNQLSGNIPESLGHLTQLRYLNLQDNQLSGSLPASLGNLAQLQQLLLNGNQLSGSIPESLGNLTQLLYLYLYDNQLGGSLPASLGNLAQLQQLLLSGNQLSGSIPESFGNLTQLQWLYLAGNRLSGNIPASLGDLTQLRELDLHANQLSGNIPASLSNLAQLQSLDLHHNELSENIPASLGNLTQLTYLSLSGNRLSGSIPASLGDLAQLTYLGLFGNQLSGDMPAFSAFHGVSIDIHNNALNLAEGSQSLANIKALIAAGNTVSYQTMAQQIPAAEYAALVALYQTTGGPGWDRRSGWLDPQAADWEGVAIEAGHVTGLYLGENQLSGSIPETLGDLAQLTHLFLYENQLSGNIPESLGNLTQLKELQLGGNQLSGSIPASLDNLTQLQGLHLSGNQLSGSIPASLGNLTQLQGLHLSGNQLSGSIPASLGNLTQLQRLYLDHNQLTGDVPAFNVVRIGWWGFGYNVDVSYNGLNIAEGSQSLANLKALIAAGNRVSYLPQAPPVLVITRAGDEITLTWPAAEGFGLEASGTLGAVWVPVTAGITTADGQSAFTVPAGAAGASFYRLAYPEPGPR